MLSRNYDDLLEAHSVHRFECHFSGRVQGVGFRYTVQNIAQRYNVHGYVKNLPDGRVELIMEGPDKDMNEIVNTVSQKMNCFIKKVDLVDLPPTGEFEHFYIRH